MITIEAVVENGLLRPMQPLPLKENEQVRITIEKKSDVQFFRRVRAASIDIKGRMVGEVIAETVVKIHKNAVLDGNVTAKSIVVEKDGIFSGQLVIGKADLSQGELLPEQKAAEASESAPETATPVAQPLPAT